MRLKQGMFLIAIMISVCTACVAQLLPEPLPEFDGPSPTAKEIHTSFEASGPKVDLTSARFVIAQSGTFFVELSNNQNMVFQDYPALQNPSLDEKRLEQFLSKATQNAMFARIPESRGDPYTLFFPFSTSFQQRTLKGLTLRFVGADCFDGLWGILGKADRKVDDWEIVGLAFPGRFAARAVATSCISSGSLSEADKKDLLDTLTQVTNNSALTLVSAKEVQINYGREPGAAVIVQEDNGDQNLFCLRKKAEQWVVSPFGPQKEDLSYAIPVDGEGIAFLQPNAEVCYAFNDSTLTVLPDMDGDGDGEILLDSAAITILFAVRTEDTHSKTPCFVTEVRGISFTP